MTDPLEWDGPFVAEAGEPAASEAGDPVPVLRKRTGRRPGNSATREEILRAARALFAERGYDGTTIRTIAKQAGVDSALVHHFFGTKEKMFSAVIMDAVHFGESLTSLTRNPSESLSDDLVGAYLRLWEDPGTASALLAVYRTVSASETAAGLLRSTSSDNLNEQLAATIDRPQAMLRATLFQALLYGIAAGRHLLKLGGLADADLDDVIAVAAPIFRNLLDDGIPGDDPDLTAGWQRAELLQAEPATDS
jgi:AcrR family transcriptional regulator